MVQERESPERSLQNLNLCNVNGAAASWTNHPVLDRQSFIYFMKWERVTCKIRCEWLNDAIKLNMLYRGENETFNDVTKWTSLDRWTMEIGDAIEIREPEQMNDAI